MTLDQHLWKHEEDIGKSISLKTQRTFKYGTHAVILVVPFYDALDVSVQFFFSLCEILSI